MAKMRVILIIMLLECSCYQDVYSKGTDEYLGGCKENENDVFDTCEEDMNPITFISKIANSEMNEQQLLHFLTHRRCYCDELFDVHRGPGKESCSIICYPCHLKPPSDIDGQLSSTPGAITQRPQSQCRSLYTREEYYVVRSCSKSYDDADVKARCEEDIPLSNLTIDTSRGVVNGGIMYFNSDCVKCNNLNGGESMYMKVYCETGLPLLRSKDIAEMLKLALQLEPYCQIFLANTNLGRYQCDTGFYRQDNLIINSCNITGTEIATSGLEEKCTNTLSDPTLRVMYKNNTFKNIFCLICNSKMLKPHDECAQASKSSKFWFGHLISNFDNAIKHFFDFKAMDDEVKECDVNEWKDPMGECRPLLCALGKKLEKDKCNPNMKLDAFYKLPYRMELLMVPETPQHAPEGSIKIETARGVSISIVQMMRELFQQHVLRLTLHVGVSLDWQKYQKSSQSTLGGQKVMDDQSFSTPSFVWVKLYLISRAGRDSSEVNILKSFNKSVLDIPFSTLYSIPYRPYFLQDSSFNFTETCNVTNTDQCDISVSNFTHVDTRLQHYPDDIEIEHTPKSEFLEIRPHLSCLYVKLGSENIQEIVSESPILHVTKIVITIGDFFMELSDPIDINQVYRNNDGTFYVCRDVFYSKAFQRMPSLLMDIIQNLMTIICMTASFVCLLFTIITYSLIPELHCVAGFNTLGLSVSLIVAQILIFVSSALSPPSMICTVVGVMAHYSWLVMFAWTFLCCLNMFRVFTGLQSITRNNPRKQRIMIITNLMASLLAPAMIIVIVMVTYTIMYNGSQIGYGHYKCAMDSAFAIHGPLMFIIACNVTFFVVAIYKIWGVRHMQQSSEVRKKNHQDFVIYIKLSTLTGIFWLLVILGEALENDIIRCLGIFANGSQGVFIFFAFIANRRVLRYYSQKFNIAPPTSDMTTTTTTDAT